MSNTTQHAGLVELTFSAKGLPNVDFLSPSDPFLVLYMTNADNTVRTPVGSTEIIKDDDSPVWVTPINVNYHPSHQMHQRYYLEIKDYDEGYSKLNDKALANRLLGTARFSLHEILANPSKSVEIPLILQKNGVSTVVNKCKALLQLFAREIESAGSHSFLSFSYNLDAISGVKYDDPNLMTQVQLLRVNPPALSPTIRVSPHTLIAQTPIQSNDCRLFQNGASTQNGVFSVSMSIDISRLTLNNWDTPIIFRILQVQSPSNTLKGLMSDGSAMFGKAIANIECTLCDIFSLVALERAKKDIQPQGVDSDDNEQEMDSTPRTILFPQDLLLSEDSSENSQRPASPTPPRNSLPPQSPVSRTSTSSSPSILKNPPPHSPRAPSSSLSTNPSSSTRQSQSSFTATLFDRSITFSIARSSATSPSILSSSLQNHPALLHPTTSRPIIFPHKFKYRPDPKHLNAPTEEIPGINTVSSDFSFPSYLKNREFKLTWSIGVSNLLNSNLPHDSEKSNHYIDPTVFPAEELNNLKSRYVLPLSVQTLPGLDSNKPTPTPQRRATVVDADVIKKNPYLNRLPSLRTLPDLEISDTNEVTIPPQQVAQLVTKEQVELLSKSNKYISAMATFIPFFQLYFPSLKGKSFQTIGSPIVNIFNERKIEHQGGSLFGFPDFFEAPLYISELELITLYIQQIGKLSRLLTLQQVESNSSTNANIIVLQSQKQPFLPPTSAVPRFSQVNQRFHISLVFTHSAASQCHLQQLEHIGKPQILIVVVLDDKDDNAQPTASASASLLKIHAMKPEQRMKAQEKYGLQAYNTSPFVDCSISGGDLNHLFANPIKPLVIEVNYKLYQSLHSSKGDNKQDEQNEWLFHEVVRKAQDYMVEYLLSKNVFPY